ncbi:MAG: CPBP family intramembrane metalloprotease [Sedimentisphaerales bacterium]|nr:CPBP family intramembrane metalloprotease [Sedimentisphaerales bacterium]
MKNLIKINPVVFYFALTCIISWFCLLPIIGIDGFLGKVTLSDDLMPLLFMAMCAGPLISSLTSVYLLDGKNGIKVLITKLLKWKVSFKFYLIALLAAPLLTILSFTILSFVSPKFIPMIFTSNEVIITIIGGIIGGLIAGFFEELGWTGFVTPKLTSKFSILKSSLIIGIVWGIWHFPLFIGQYPSSQVPIIILLMALLITHLPAFRILMTWVYERTQSLFIALLMHMSLTASALIFQADIKDGIDIIVSNLTFTIILYVMVFMINKVTKGQIVKGVF